MRLIVKLLIFISTILIVPISVSACGADTNCMIGDRHYRIAMPVGHDNKTPVGAIVFAHGYQGTAAGVMRNKTLRRVVSELGVALIAVKSVGQDWDIPHAPRKPNSDGSNEYKYFDAVIRDASSKFAIDTDKLMATGFSAGGMMVWNLICSRSDKFVAFSPMAGTFWLEVPQDCKHPITNVIHIHGLTDRTVPLKGRPIADTHQGDVFQTIEMYKKFGKFKEPTEFKASSLTCQNHKNVKGDLLNFCLYPGQHKFSSQYVKFAWETFAKAGLF